MRDLPLFCYTPNYVPSRIAVPSPYVHGISSGIPVARPVVVSAYEPRQVFLPTRSTTRFVSSASAPRPVSLRPVHHRVPVEPFGRTPEDSEVNNFLSSFGSQFGHLLPWCFHKNVPILFLYQLHTKVPRHQIGVRFS